MKNSRIKYDDPEALEKHKIYQLAMEEQRLLEEE
jgi:hypothetical protein